MTCIYVNTNTVGPAAEMNDLSFLPGLCKNEQKRSPPIFFQQPLLKSIAFCRELRCQGNFNEKNYCNNKEADATESAVKKRNRS